MDSEVVNMVNITLREILRWLREDLMKGQEHTNGTR